MEQGAIMTPSFMFVLRAAWRDTLSTLKQLRYLAFIVFLIWVAELVAWSFLLPDGGLGKILNVLLSLIPPLATVPYQIAIFRLIILGEPTAGYSFRANINRVHRYLTWSLVLWAATTVPGLVFDLLPLSNSLNASLSIAFSVAAVVAIIRLILLFPAIAVDASGASVANAFADSSGHFWFIVRSTLVAWLPFMIVAIVVIAWVWFAYVSGISYTGTGLTLIGVVLLGAIGTVTMTTSYVIAARLFEWIGSRVK
ncbi:MAG: hypothetical protein EKK42_32845 [Pseudonocardiaceae bacterium]|nr:MAG: hypothetical protein EKK42_32845 [Pseudonocardiaceae bacterium]